MIKGFIVGVYSPCFVGGTPLLIALVFNYFALSIGMIFSFTLDGYLAYMVSALVSGSFVGCFGWVVC